MVKIRYDPQAYRLTARGHAGSGDPGQDLVCAGVSALVLALREMLLRMEKKGQVQLKVLSTELGSAQFWCAPAPGCQEQLRCVFETVVSGMALMHCLFADYVQLRVQVAPAPEERKASRRSI